MYKKYFLLCFVVFAAVLQVSAQDICKQIKKDITDNNTSFSYETPYSEDNMPTMRAIRNYSTNSESEFDNFNLILSIPCEFSDLLTTTSEGDREKEEMGVVIHFEDKSTIKEDSIQITHDKRGDGTAFRIAYVQITEQNVKAFTTKKIVKFTLATAHQEVVGDLSNTIQQYLVCLKNVKKM